MFNTSRATPAPGTAVLAAFAWHAAQRDEKLPRKPMPPPVHPVP